MATTKRTNYFELLELVSTETDRATIEAAIKRKETQWSNDSLYASGEAQAVAKRNFALLEDTPDRKGIRSVMLSDNAERRTKSREWADAERKLAEAMEEELLNESSVLAAQGYLLKPAYEDLIRKFGEPAVTRVVRVPVVVTPPEHEKLYMEERSFRKLVGELEHIEKRDLYHLLDKPQNTPTAELLDRANEILKKVRPIAHKNVQLNMQKEVLQKCLTIFRNDIERGKYENSLARRPVEQAIGVSARSVLKHHGHFGHEETEKLIAVAIRKGVSKPLAAEFLNWLERNHAGSPGSKYPVDMPQKCAKCQHHNDAGAEACSRCGQALLVACSKCGGKKPFVDPACTSCGFSEKDAGQFRTFLAEASDLLVRGKFADARSRMADAARLLPDSDEVRRLGDDADERELDALLKRAQSNLDGNQLDEAIEALSKAGGLSPDDPRVAELRRKHGGRSRVKESLAALVAAIQDGTSERRILAAWEAVVEGGGQNDAVVHQARIELARSRVQALDLADLGEDFEGDRKFVAQFTPMATGLGGQSLRLETCHDDAVQNLNGRMKTAAVRIGAVDALCTLVQEADAGRAHESQIAHHGRTLRSDYFPTLFDRVQLAVQLAAEKPDTAKVADLWERIEKGPFCPKHAPILEQCRRISQSVRATRMVSGLTSGVSETDDRKYLEAFETCELGRVDGDGQLTDRYRQTQARLRKLDAIGLAVEEADAGRAGEEAIVAAADGAGLPANYRYRLSPRVEIARALAERPRSDRRVAQAVENLADDGLMPRWSATIRDLRLAERRRRILDDIVALPTNQSREARDVELVRVWDAELLRDCHDASPYELEAREAGIRQKKWSRITALLDRGGDPTDLELGLESVKEYDGYAKRRHEIEALTERSKRIRPLLDALNQHDNQGFVKAFDPRVIQEHWAAFQDHQIEIERIVRESMSAVLKAVPSEPAWSWDHIGQNLDIHWSLQPREFTSLSVVATNDRQFYLDVAETNGRIREVSATAVRGLSLRGPRSGERLYVTVWPVLMIGDVRMYGTPACIGPIEPRSEPSRSSGDKKPFQWHQFPRRMANWLARKLVRF